MRLIAKNPRLFTQASIYTATVIRILLNLLLIVIVGALALGVYKTGYDLIHSINQPLEAVLQHVLLDIVFIAALVEISITILGYLKDGSVHVRYIIDTILIIMLNEIVSMWFDKPKPGLAQASGLALTVAVLAGIRLSVMYTEHKYKTAE
jgi:uncharacterized membrane protein (DUF373 family)